MDEPDMRRWTEKERRWIWITAFVFALTAFAVSNCVGRYPISLREVFRCFLHRLFDYDGGISTEAETILWNVRLPRAAAGALVGASLAVSGCAFQGMFQNPLVSQGILGVSSGAGFGAALSILLFSGTMFVPFFAFIFGLAAVFLSFLVARLCKGSETMMLVLGGTIISSIFSALLSFLKYVADPYNELASIVFWNMGSLASIETEVFPYSAAAMVIGILILISQGLAINVLSMGEREAQSMGLPAAAVRFLVILGATLATAGAVSLSGTIGWVGLIIPHMARFFVGSDNRKLLPFSMLLGAGFMMLIDVLCRTLTGAEIPLGIMTSLIGGPFFLYLLIRYKGGVWR
ncbi:MAG: iron ABC transporter permease [Clostridium sp.]|nr:iron ABC transporter permease [Clostridium sp.]